MQHAHAYEPVQNGRVFIEKINAPFLFGDKATASEHHAGIAYAIEQGWIEMHENLCALYPSWQRPIRLSGKVEITLDFLRRPPQLNCRRIRRQQADRHRHQKP